MDNMRISLWFFWIRKKGHLPKLYVIGVTIAGIYADYYLSNFPQILADKLRFTYFFAAATINFNDAVNAIFGIIGAILCDVSLTHYGMIFLSSMIYCIGLSIIAVQNQRSDYAISYYAAPILDQKVTRFAVSGTTISLVVVGLFVSGVGKLSLMNSSQMLSEENIDTTQRTTSSFTNFVKFVFGDDTAILRYVQSHGYIIVLVFTKYATKTVFIVVSSLLGRRYTNSTAGFVYGDKIALWIPAVGLGIASLISCVYVRSFRKPSDDRQQTPLKHVLRVYVAAFQKRHILCPPDPPTELLYEENPEYQLHHTVGFRFLDKAAIIQSAEPREERKRWKLCTVTEVEETKVLLRMLPMCATFIGYGVVKSMGNTIFLLQGTMMDNRFGSIDVPIQALIIIGEISGSIVQGVYGLLLSKRLSGSGRMHGAPVKYSIGMVLATFCCTVASWIATDKANRVLLWRTKYEELGGEFIPESVFWLIPQFILFGAMSEVTRDAIKGFFHDQLPPSMVRYDSVFTDVTAGAGAIFSVLITYALSFGQSQSIRHYFNVDSYYTDYSLFSMIYYEANKELARYYRALTVFSFIFLIVYAFIATRYKYKDSSESPS